jgi:hypothetical protein
MVPTANRRLGLAKVAEAHQQNCSREIPLAFAKQPDLGDLRVDVGRQLIASLQG